MVVIVLLLAARLGTPGLEHQVLGKVLKLQTVAQWLPAELIPAQHRIGEHGLPIQLDFVAEATGGMPGMSRSLPPRGPVVDMSWAAGTPR